MVGVDPGQGLRLAGFSIGLLATIYYAITEGARAETAVVGGMSIATGLSFVVFAVELSETVQIAAGLATMIASGLSLVAAAVSHRRQS